jgi:hypothetical protein
MAAELQIRFVEDASGGGASYGPTPTPQPSPSPAPSSAPGPAAPGPSATGGPSRSAGDVIGAFVRAIGGSGITEATRHLVQSFREASAALRLQGRQAGIGPRPTTGGNSFDWLNDIYGPATPRTNPLTAPGAGGRNVQPGPNAPPITPPAPSDTGGAAGMMSSRVLLLGAAVTSAVVAVKLFGDAMKSQAESLAQYSGPLSGAIAQAEIRDMMAEMRRAQAIGPELAKLYNAWNQAENWFYDEWTKFMRDIAWIMNKLGLLADTKEEDAEDPFTTQLDDLRRGLEGLFPDIKNDPFLPQPFGPGNGGGDW